MQASFLAVVYVTCTNMPSSCCVLLTASHMCQPQVVQTLGNLCHTREATILLSLLQPAPEVGFTATGGAGSLFCR